jgi:hypothetical protein
MWRVVVVRIRRLHGPHGFGQATGGRWHSLSIGRQHCGRIGRIGGRRQLSEELSESEQELEDEVSHHQLLLDEDGQVLLETDVQEDEGQDELDRESTGRHTGLGISRQRQWGLGRPQRPHAGLCWAWRWECSDHCGTSGRTHESLEHEADRRARFTARTAAGPAGA